MTRFFKGVKGFVSLAILVFIVCVIGGVYTALDSATAISPRVSEAQASEYNASSLASSIFNGKVEQAEQAVMKAAKANNREIDETVQVDGQEESPAAESPSSPESKTPSDAKGAPSSSNSSGSAPNNKTWVEPVYRTVHHEAEYKTTNYPDEYSDTTDYYTQCNDCPYKVQGSIYPHQDETGHGRYSTNVPVTTSVLVKAAWSETVLVKEAWDEKILVSEGYWK